ncbi:MAG TPA: peptidoglycan DD-metalloendopeptidase family protein [Burkholderiales bacterium]|nr:peptidoglycan DD-metalloendopeptidase family protein [Burkholderiales bacterium]
MSRATRPSLLLAWLLLLALPVYAGPSDQLKELRGRIDKLQRQLTESEETKSEAADALRESERAISDANRRLFELAGKQRELQAALSRLEEQRSRTGDDADRQEALLAKLLYQQYLSGQPEPLRLLVNRQDPNQIARQMHYLSYISRARTELIAALRRDESDLERLAAEAQAKSRELSHLQGDEADQKKQLLRERRRHTAVLKQVSDQISRQRTEITHLKRNEDRLARLVDRLARELARQGTREGRVRNELLPEPPRGAGPFSGLKGRLRLPVTGELVNEFGSPRADSGLSWKGLFIAASQGQEVQAVAAGRVVFADWLRGFGNLMILDHGGGYMSLYGNNEALFRQVGDMVKAGDPIAAVGATGGNPETGLYFELRFQGKPFDPLTWVTLK